MSTVPTHPQKVERAPAPLLHPALMPDSAIDRLGTDLGLTPAIDPATTDIEHDKLHDSHDPTAMRRGREWSSDDDRRYYNAEGGGWR